VAEGFACAVNEVNEGYSSACKDLSEEYQNYQNSGYCVLHYPGAAKNKEDFLEVKNRKLD
jgi:uncharacterized protein YjbI with pentapeptide repeats